MTKDDWNRRKIIPQRSKVLATLYVNVKKTSSTLFYVIYNLCAKVLGSIDISILSVVPSESYATRPAFILQPNMSPYLSDGEHRFPACRRWVMFILIQDQNSWSYTWPGVSIIRCLRSASTSSFCLKGKKDLTWSQRAKLFTANNTLRHYFFFFSFFCTFSKHPAQ